jgi:GTP diphosphokinase / guanosine-3',5'-bis(diphosphate) 3'-diphosphatase
MTDKTATAMLGVNAALLMRALSFSADKHRHQKRKDVDESPYILHPIAVATVLAVEGNVTDETLLIAALLHDTVEDVGVTHAELVWHFGVIVADLVMEVSDDKNLPKQTRKELQVEHAGHSSDRAKQLKVADKTCNIRDIMHTPPTDWSLEHRQEYLEWTKRVVDNCRGVNLPLEAVYDSVLQEGEKLLAGGV